MEAGLSYLCSIVEWQGCGRKQEPGGSGSLSLSRHTSECNSSYSQLESAHCLYSRKNSDSSDQQSITFCSAQNPHDQPITSTTSTKTEPDSLMPIKWPHNHTPTNTIKHHRTSKQHLESNNQSQLPLRRLIQKPWSIHLLRTAIREGREICFPNGSAGLKLTGPLHSLQPPQRATAQNIPFQSISPNIPPLLTKLYRWNTVVHRSSHSFKLRLPHR